MQFKCSERTDNKCLNLDFKTQIRDEEEAARAVRSILGQEAAKEAAAASSTTTSKRGRRSAAAASKRSSPKEESNKENRRRSTAAALGHRLQSSSAEDMVKSGGGDVDVDDPETHAVVEVQFVTNQVPAKRVSAQLGEIPDSQNSQKRSKMKCICRVC